MFVEQNIVVDRLVRAIQSVQLDRYTGTLTATRGTEPDVEVGRIEFLMGQVVQASLGRDTGQDALNRLSTWGACHVCFMYDSTAEGARQHRSLLSFLPEQRAQPLGNASDQQPIGQQARPGNERQTTPLPLTSAWNDTAKNGAGPLPAFHPRPIVPHPLKSGRVALQFIARAGLSRTHRHLFLLVDGVRSVAEIAHILRRSEQEVHAILFDLQTIGCITFLSPAQAEQES